MPKELPNVAYIDGTNLHKGIEELGWTLDYKKFRTLLADKYDVGKAYIFMGEVKEFTGLYTSLQEAGFIVELKQTTYAPARKVKGNCDVNLTWQLARDDCAKKFKQAVVVTGDGDFVVVLRSLAEENKLRVLLCPNREKTSRLLTEHPLHKLYYKFTFLEDLRGRIEHRKGD